MRSPPAMVSGGASAADRYESESRRNCSALSACVPLRNLSAAFLTEVPLLSWRSQYRSLALPANTAEYACSIVCWPGMTPRSSKYLSTAGICSAMDWPGVMPYSR
jgi:hypothetical protein